ncbi:hypothetical protein DR950_06570 [Kitasatospora xanthocidica]|uniref:Peptidase S1 domain-containing protein n=1 Tax=Kitasatospora xanthocidica TaxID=83382 RepID=A0A372ZNS2_9ACTN|nr:trypsin-like serine protease [Kitasatospora xanthocidica]RGD57506.1 hypothetical protein DR950_06570 [Kitasatospora xanthocidica]
MRFRFSTRRPALTAASVAMAGLLLGAQAGPATAISGGTPAAPGQDLEDVAFLHPDGSLACEGAIISANTILTSAECVDGEHGLELTFRYGSHDDHAGGRIGLIAETVVYPGYDSTTHAGDLAVVHPVTPLILDANAQPIPLSSADSPPAAGSTVTVSGWGEPAGNADTMLQEAQANVISASACQSEVGPGYTIPPYTLCTQSTATTVSYSPRYLTYPQDSGDPMVQDGKLVGISTRSVRTPLQFVPLGQALYSSTPYVLWIRNNS